MTVVVHNEKASEKSTNGTPQTQSQGEHIQVPLSQIERDEEFNARQGDSAYRNIPELAESVKQNGQLQEVTVMVNKKGAEKPYFMVNGFRRGRAFEVIAKETKTDPMVNVFVKPFEGERFEERLMEAKWANLASDGGTDPLRDYEYAARCQYFHSKLGASPKKIAKFIGKHEQTVYTYLKLFEKLSPEVKTAWSSAPDPEKEIPVSKLLQWSKRGPAEQKALMEKYVSGDDSPLYEGGSSDDGGSEGKPPKKRIDKEKPGTKDIKAELEKIQTKMEDAKGQDLARLEGASKALRYVLGDISRVF